MTTIQMLSDKDLRAAAKVAVSDDRKACVQLALHLAEIETRGLHLEWGFSSLWDYCTRELALKDGTANTRIRLGRLMRKRPEVMELVLSGRLGRCAASLLESYRDKDDFAELLAVAVGKSRREFEDFLTERSGKPAPKNDSIRKVNVGLALEEKKTEAAAEELKPTAAPKPVVVKDHQVTFMASEELVEKIKLAKDLEGTDELSVVLGKALDMYLKKKDPVERVARREAKPRKVKQLAAKKPAAKRSRYVPVAVRDQVMAAGGRRCTYEVDGVRCGARRHLQADHIQAWALGGSSDPKNLRPLCRAHNLLLARKQFGDKVPRRQVNGEFTSAG